MNGYGGRILSVDLSTGLSRIDTFDERFARLYLGGNGFAARILYDRMRPGIDAYDPRNVVVLAVGPVTDSNIPGNSRICLATKSPLTGLFFDSTFGGRFPCTFKRTGFDALVITGQAPRPVYLVLTPDGLQIKRADTLWGTLTHECVERVHMIEGDDADVTCIGPAGERLVRFAAMAHYWKNRGAIAGRGGLGAVLGAKRVKAIVVSGNRKMSVADQSVLSALYKSTYTGMLTGTKALSTFGTAFLVQPINTMGALGTKNLAVEVFDQADAISGERFKDDYWERDTTCLKCPVACGKDFKVAEGEFAGTRWKMPEYESIFALGSMLENANAASLIKANELCDQLGMDTISMGVTIAFAMECAERGLLASNAIVREVHWGDYHTMLELVEDTAYRRGFGDLLAEGSRHLATRLGGEAHRYLYAVKGLELPAHSARALKGMSIGYATATRGGSHHDTRPTMQYRPDFDHSTIEGKPAYALRSQHYTAVGDSLVLCRFTGERGFGMLLNDHFATMINGVTGFGLSTEDIERTGERIVNLERAFNVREGVRRKDDSLPYRVMHEPIPFGPSKGRYCPPDELSRMLDEYYSLRGWTRDGVPTKGRLATLDLEDVAETIR
ncbi:MAG: aldehyde ferredoxin oxidoreductase family protein [Nitrospinae bacterium]|nr:aldehyde ferredoxin oxidoreductase family protein [Nitrospinota bacterium]